MYVGMTNFVSVLILRLTSIHTDVFAELVYAKQFKLMKKSNMWPKAPEEVKPDY